jgi:N-acetylmuramoyl-L-alanine amidase
MKGWPVSDQPAAPERRPGVQPGHRSRLLRITVVLTVIMAALVVGGVVLGQLAKNPVSGASSSSHGTQSSSKQSPDATSAADSSAASSSAGSTATAVNPTLFAQGACMSFPPTSGDRHITVFLDAGHGGLDPGGVGETESGQQVEESDVNLSIELDTMATLRAQGFRVVVSRTGNTTVHKLGAGDTDGQELSLQGALDDVAARDVCANMADADLLVGIYMDAGVSPQNAGSVTTYDTDRPFSAESLAFATLLQDDVLSAMKAQGWAIPNDGVVSDASEGSLAGNPADGGLAAQAADYDHLLLLGPAEAGYFTTPSQMAGAVIEPLFLTDPYEGSLAASAADQAVIAQGIAGAIEQYFAPASATSPTTMAG